MGEAVGGQAYDDTAQSAHNVHTALWCCCGDSGIVIYETDDGQCQRCSWTTQLGCINDVTEMISGDAIVASDEGLFQVNGAIGNDFFVEVLVM